MPLFCKQSYGFVWIGFLIGSRCLNATADKQNQAPYPLEASHKKVTEELVNLRKNYPLAQPKIYSVLDEINQMNSKAKQLFQQGIALQEMIKTKELENVALHQDLLLMKSECDTLHKKLANASKTLDEEKKRNKLVFDEKKSLEKKMVSLQNTTTTTVEAAVRETLEKELKKNDEIDD